MVRRAWRKILYEKQDYPDNYVDRRQFLNGLRKNLYTQTYTLREVVIASGVVTQELSSVCFFVGIYWFVQEGWLLPAPLFLSSLLVTAMGFTAAICLWVGSDRGNYTLAGLLTDYVKPTAIFVLFLAGVSPILKTLTESISTDTIWAMTVGMLGAHLVFHNYGSEGALTVLGAVESFPYMASSVVLSKPRPITTGGELGLGRLWQIAIGLKH